jgi:hypothetical protein
MTPSQIETRRAAIRTLIDSAGSTILSVEFTKVDGSTRVMQCQTHAGKSLLAGDAASASAKQGVETRKANNPHLRAVYDIGKRAWRSMNLDSMFALTVRGVRYTFDPIA